jgi:hypothetical protein
MPENIIIVIIEAFSVILSPIFAALIGYFIARQQLKDKYEIGLRNKRMETYPELIKITQELGKSKTSYQDHKNAREEIIKWTTADHGGFLTLSKKTLDYFNQLKELLKKNAGDGKQYSKEQLKNIFNTRNSLRGSMMDDISVSGIKKSD